MIRNDEDSTTISKHRSNINNSNDGNKYILSDDKINQIINGTFNINDDITTNDLPEDIREKIRNREITVSDVEVNERDLINKLQNNHSIERKGWLNKSFTPGKKKNRINQLAKIKDKCFTKGKEFTRQQKRALYGKDIRLRNIQKITLGDLQAISNMKGIFEWCNS